VQFTVLFCNSAFVHYHKWTLNLKKETQSMRIALAATLLAFTPVMGFAAGTGIPAPTETTEDCADGLIFDLATQTCIGSDQSTNDDSAMMNVVRELAYYGRYADARAVLDKLDPNDTMVQTYYGFTARKLGDFDVGMAHYKSALLIDPDNTLALSYMGQGMVERGDLVGARMQLSQIRERGGRQTWPEIALRMAIESGVGPSY
jgi:tetratricopeptide (TPR) repeat protein